MKQSTGKLFGLLTLTTGSMFAALVPIQTVPSTGNGLGAVNSIVTFQNTGTEIGCVGNVGGSFGEGSTQCQGITAPPGGVTHEQTGSGNNIYTAAALGIASTGTNTFANAILIFNGNEGGGANAPISVDELALNLFTATGTPLASFSLAAPFAAAALPGAGNAGFGFQLDAAQSAIANALLDLNPTLVIGASVIASGANAGPDTVSISRIDTIQQDDEVVVPEPTTVFLMGGGLIGLSLIRRKVIA